MMLYLCLAILFIPLSKNISKSVDVNESRYQPGLYQVKEINKKLFFSFIDFYEIDCKFPKNLEFTPLIEFCEKAGPVLLRKEKIVNYYPFLLFFLLTFTRWIAIGKHFWQRP